MAKWTLMTLFFLVLTSGAFGLGHSVGNGGDGIVLDGRVYLYDLVEHGLHKNPYWAPGNTVTQDLQELVDVNLERLSPAVRKLVALKISEVAKVDAVFAALLKLALKTFQWHLIEDFSLVEINDEDGSDVMIPRDRFKQVAVRSLGSIKIDQSLIENMDSENQAALVLHELIYGVLPIRWTKIELPASKSIEVGQPSRFIDVAYQSSQLARQITAYVFTPSFARKGREGLHAFLPEELATKFPGSTVLEKKDKILYRGRLNYWTYGFSDRLTIQDQAHLDDLKETYCDRNSGSEGVVIQFPFYLLGLKVATYDGVRDGSLKKLSYLMIVGSERGWNSLYDLKERTIIFRPTSSSNFFFDIKNKEMNRSQCRKAHEASWRLFTTNDMDIILSDRETTF
ncbi:MAG: hypothetical protein ACK5Y2_09120 [Bdellovibrionales bacterium]